MCGRYELSLGEDELSDLLGLVSVAGFDATPRLDVRPTEQVPLVINEETPQLKFASWGVEAPWNHARSINIRDDKLAGTWREFAEMRRCLIPASAFFEWREVPGKKRKQKIRFSLLDNKPFAFAGLWEFRGDQLACAIITTTPNELVESVHDRMPAILTRDAQSLWCVPGKLDIEAVRSMVKPYAADQMTSIEIHDGPPELPPAQGSLF